MPYWKSTERRHGKQSVARTRHPGNLEIDDHSNESSYGKGQQVNGVVLGVDGADSRSIPADGWALMPRERAWEALSKCLVLPSTTLWKAADGLNQRSLVRMKGVEDANDVPERSGARGEEPPRARVRNADQRDSIRLLRHEPAYASAQTVDIEDIATTQDGRDQSDVSWRLVPISCRPSTNP